MPAPTAAPSNCKARSRIWPPNSGLPTRRSTARWPRSSAAARSKGRRERSRSCVPAREASKPCAVVRRGKVELRPDRHDAGRVHLALAVVIVPLDLLQAHGLGYARHLIEIAHVIRQVRILVNVPPVALEV